MTDFIYTLSDPRDNQIRYVGKTDNPERRLAMHLNERYKSYKTNWVKGLVTDGLKPILTVIETVEEGQNWEDRERYWISHYRSIGCNLTNGTDGGDQGPDCTGKHLIKSETARGNIIAAITKRNKSPEMREVSRRNGQSNKGRKRPAEVVEKIRQKQIGRKVHTDASKQALAERNRTRKYNSEIMSKVSRQGWDDPVKGPEMRAKFADRRNSEEFQRALTEGLKKRVFDPAIMREKSRKLWDDPIKGPALRAKLAKANKAHGFTSEQAKEASHKFWDDPVGSAEARERLRERMKKKHQKSLE